MLQGVENRGSLISVPLARRVASRGVRPTLGRLLQEHLEHLVLAAVSRLVDGSEAICIKPLNRLLDQLHATSRTQKSAERPIFTLRIFSGYF